MILFAENPNPAVRRRSICISDRIFTAVHALGNALTIDNVRGGAPFSRVTLRRNLAPPEGT